MHVQTERNCGCACATPGPPPARQATECKCCAAGSPAGTEARLKPERPRPPGPWEKLNKASAPKRGVWLRAQSAESILLCNSICTTSWKRTATGTEHRSPLGSKTEEFEAHNGVQWSLGSLGMFDLHYERTHTTQYTQLHTSQRRILIYGNYTNDNDEICSHKNISQGPSSMA